MKHHIPRIAVIVASAVFAIVVNLLIAQASIELTDGMGYGIAVIAPVIIGLGAFIVLSRIPVIALDLCYPPLADERERRHATYRMR